LISTAASLEALPELLPCALAIGNFDGVHLGHRRILEQTRSLASRHGLEAAVLTFDPHPTRIVAPARLPKLLTTPAQRLALFDQCALDRTVVLEFTAALAQLSPEQFVSQVLVEKLHARWVVVGSNFRFGKGGAGTIETLRSLGGRNFEVLGVGPVEIGGAPVSSSRTRGLIAEGRIALARKLLGRAFAVEGSVVPGRGVGSRQTVPTLNLAPQDVLWPADGVYVTCTEELPQGRRWESVTNVGHRPTFGGVEPVIETHLLTPLNGPGPGQIRVCFHRRLRDEKRFESPEALRSQILFDAARARRFFRLVEASGRGKLAV
jgi:riboflavin kinase/FMN adenylyltransferase